MEVFDQYAKNYDQWYEKPFGSSAFKLEVSCLKKILGSFSLSLEVGVGRECRKVFGRREAFSV
ncbi:hypothetical protein [Thermocrinis sp.]